MKTLKMNTGLWNVLNFNMYDSALSIDSALSDLLPDGYDVWVDVKYEHEKYQKDLAQFGLKYITEKLTEFDLPFEIKLENPSVYSPREYNYHGDELDFDMLVPDNYIETLVTVFEKDYLSLAKYFRKNFGSYNGFFSFFPLPDTSTEMPRDYIERCIREDKIEYVIGGLLLWLDITLDQTEFENDWLEHTCESLHDYVHSDSLDALITSAVNEGLI